MRDVVDELYKVFGLSRLSGLAITLGTLGASRALGALRAQNLREFAGRC